MKVIDRLKGILLTVILILLSSAASSQEQAGVIDYSTSDDYIIGGVSISGVRFLDTNALIGISGLRINQEVSVPGEAITNAVRKLWQQGLFSNRWLLLGIAVELLLAAAVVYVPLLHPWFGTAALSPGEFFLAWPFAVGLLLLDEMRRWWLRRGNSLEVES